MSTYGNQRLGDSAAYRAATQRGSVPVTQEQAAVLARSVAMYPEVPAGFHVAAMNMPNGDQLLEQANVRAQAAVEPKPKKKKGILDRATGFVGDVAGGVASGARSVAGAVLPDQAEAVLHPLQDAAGAAGEALKPGARTVFTALEAPLQFATGAARQGYGIATGQQEWEGVGEFLGEAGQQTTLGQVIEGWVKGEDIDIGNGFFPGGRMVDERVQAERNAAMIGNSAWTAGRWLAADVLQIDQGSTAYNIVSGIGDGLVAWFGDPTNAGLVKGAKASRARKLGTEIVGAETVAKAAAKATPEWRQVVDEALGVVEGNYKMPRNTALVSNAAKWLYSNEGRRVVTKMTEEMSASELWRATGKKIPLRIVNQIAGSEDPVEVANVLVDAMTSSVREIPTMGKVRGVTGVADRVVKNRQEAGRLFNMLPSDPRIDWDDIETSFRNLDAAAANANINGEKRRELLDKWAEALTAPKEKTQARYDALNLWSETLNEQLVANNVRPDIAEAITSWTRKIDEINDYDIDDLANGIGFNADEGAGPFMVSQLLHTGAYLYDPEQVRKLREVTVNNKILRFAANNPAWRAPVSFIAAFQSELWKPAQLINPKYLAKILPEEGLRVKMGGAIQGPLGWMRTVFGDQYSLDATGGAFRTLAQRADELVDQRDLAQEIIATSKSQRRIEAARKELADIEREFIDLNEQIAKRVDDQYTAAMNAGRPNALFDDAGFERDVAQQVRRGNKQLARADQNPEEWVLGQGESILLMSKDPVAIRVANGGLFPGDESPSGLTGLDAIVDWLNLGAGKKFRDQMADVQGTDAVARKMVQVAADNIMYRTGNDPRLLEAIAKGTVDGVPAGQASHVFGFSPSEKLREVLEDVRLNNPDVSDFALFTPTEATKVRGAGRDMNRFLEARDNVTRWFFSGVYGKSTDKLNRSPAFRSFYWRRVEELAPHMSKEAADELYEVAKGVLPTKQLKALRDKTKMAAGDLDRETVDAMAGYAALDDTNDLLFNAKNRTQLFDVLRAVMPFGEAWREILTSYSRLIRQNPHTIRRFQQGVNALRGSGIMYTNEYGEESIAIPASGALLNVFGGVNGDLSMAAKSLSIGTSVMPGFGPIVSVPIYRMIPDEPGTDWVREVLFPYGEPQGLDLIPLPAWAKKLTEAAGWTDGRTAASTVNQAMNLLAVKDFEKYKGDPELLLNDAKAVAQGTLVARGLAQLFSPGAPQVRYIAETKNGDVVAMKLADEFRKLQAPQSEGGQGLDYQHAVIEFLDTYGTGAAFYLSGNTEAKVKGLDATDAFTDFERENGWLFGKHTEIAGYFGPHGGEFDYAAYVRQLEAGYRRSLTPNERIAAANQVIGNMKIAAAKDQMPPQSEWGDYERAYMRYLKGEIEKEYPGYTRYADYDVNEVKRQIEDLFEAAQDPRLQDNEVAQAVLAYKKDRDEMLALAQSMGRVGFDTSEDTAMMRAFLLFKGDALAEETPAFVTVWERLLSREVESE